MPPEREGRAPDSARRASPPASPEGGRGPGEAETLSGGAHAVEIRGLRREFSGKAVVDGLSLHVARGETVALLGPNGAGKTTTISILTTMLHPSGGTAKVAGFDVVEQPLDVRRQIGVVFQGPSLEVQLSARENLRFHADIYKVPRAQAQERIEELLREAELAERGDEPVYRFSGGMRRRLELVRAVLHRPRVLFLDEPTIGLDPQARLYTWDLLEKLQRDEGMAVLVTTHDMQEADRLADRVAIMDHGKLLVADTPMALKGSIGQGQVVLRLARAADAKAAGRLAKALGALPGVASVDGGDRELRLRLDRPERALPAIVQVVDKHGVELEGMDVRQPTLEDVFIARTGHALRDQS